jgi:membrane protein
LRRIRARRKLRLRWYAVLSRAMHRTILSVLAHDCLNVAQSTAYSAIVALFPALIVAAAVIGLLPDTAPVRYQLADFFDRVLPAGVSALLDAAFENAPKHAHSVRALVSAAAVSFASASNVISSLMEGLRRASELPRNSWGFWQRRRRSFELVPLSLLPLTVASLLVVFGHAVTGWLIESIGPEARAPIYAASLLLRWAIALGASVGLIALLYRMGVPNEESAPGGSVAATARAAVNRRGWDKILPGAILATALWFPATLFFGWYVTRFTNYTEVYGPLGVGIALLFWLYIISLSVLCGAEFNMHFNAQVDTHFTRKSSRQQA